MEHIKLKTSNLLCPVRRTYKRPVHYM